MFYQRTVLSNGMRVITEKLPHVQSVALGIWVYTGSRHEHISVQGISHFLEHMCFKGTSSRSAADIARLIDSVGGNLNAFTSRENTCFSARVMAEHLDIAIDLLCDIVFQSVFDPTETEREKAVVYEEISMYEDSPEDLIHDLHIQHCWPDHPLGYPTLGNLETIAKFSQDTLKQHFSAHYTPDKIVVTAAGSVNHQLLVEALSKKLGSLRSPGKEVAETPPFMQSGGHFQRKALEQLHLCLGTRGISRAHPDHFAFVLLSIILGGGMSSRLFQRIREQEALAYSVFSYLNGYRDAGLFVVYAGIGKNNFSRTVNIILEEFSRAKNQTASTEELQRAKEQFKGSFILGMESTENHMGRLAKLEFYHDHFYSVEEVIAEVEKITPEEIKALANNYFSSESLTLTCLGDLAEPKDFKLDC